MALCMAGFLYTFFSMNVRVKRIVLPAAFLCLGCVFVAVAWPLRAQIPWVYYAMIRGGRGFSDRGVSGFLPGQYSNRRTEIHEETKT